MSGETLLAKLIARLAKTEAKKGLSRYYPPSQGDVLHDGLVGAGQTWGGILGLAAGALGGEAVGGPLGAAAGSAALGEAGDLGGAWAAHGAYREGQLIDDILSHPEHWTVDAAGAIVPTTQDQTSASDASVARTRPAPSGAAQPEVRAGLGSGIRPPAYPSSPIQVSPTTPSQIGSGSTNSNQASSAFTTGATPTPQLAVRPQNRPGGLLGMMIDAGYIDPANRPAVGLVGLMQDYLRNNPSANSAGLSPEPPIEKMN